MPPEISWANKAAEHILSLVRDAKLINIWPK